MISMSCNELIKAVDGELLYGSFDTVFSGITTDSRKVLEGNLFIPLIGEKFDGHDYIEQCVIKGAKVCLTSKAVFEMQGCTMILVSDTAKALRDLAKWYLAKFCIPVVGITGSVGKTSTKDMVSCVLSRQFEVLKTQGNFNNEIGLPLTVFNLDDSHEAAVLEMGMSGFGEISRLTAIAKPDIAIITNIGVSHIEKLGSQEGILKAKLEIIEGLKDGGLLILNGDDPMLLGLRGKLGVRCVYYGMNEENSIRAQNYTSHGECGCSFDIVYQGISYPVRVPVPGIHNVYNALAAIAAGIELQIPLEIAIEGIADYVPGNMRQNIISYKDIKIINDTYNASPQSMKASLSVLEELSKGNGSIAVLGDMLEMGDLSKEMHYCVGEFAAELNIDCIVTVGPNSRSICEAVSALGNRHIKLESFDNNEDALRYILRVLRPGNYVLVKGSRGMKMETIIDGIMKEYI